MLSLLSIIFTLGFAYWAWRNYERGRRKVAYCDAVVAVAYATVALTGAAWWAVAATSALVMLDLLVELTT